MTICFATNNVHKREEVQAMLGQQIQLVTLQEIGCVEELREDQETLEGNSWQKADYVFNTYRIPCFADDTGLEVEALHGRPGVDTAHYAGGQRSAVDNMDFLLRNMEGVENRSAQFRTVITLRSPQFTKQFVGVAKGTIALAKKGEGGFGYNPIFIPEGFSRTMAEMTMEEKNSISHRALAVQGLATFLKNNPNL